ncbi:exported hypothetical protein [Clostridiaceae bacterium BL-3]|nr:exported hypothetical protein [Clostridiaceae bacterium BL-3]
MKGMKKIIGKIVMLLFVIGIALSGFTGNVYADSSSAGNMSTTANENRLWGEDRIETSLKISQEGWKYGAATAVIAQGYGYADALCAAPLAKKYNAPIILSRQGSLDDETIKELKRLKVDRAFVIGGTGSLSDNVESQLKDIGVSVVKRLGGQDRYETSVKIAEELENVSNIVVASGSGYADSLSIAAIAAKKGMPILLSQSDALPQAVKNYLKNRNIEKTYIIGGTGVISSNLESSLTNAVRLGGDTRFDTNLAVLQNFKSDLNFSNVYVARGNGPNGDEFADALSGSALAATESAPVVLTDNTVASKTADFLKENMSDKTVIIALGGIAVVPAVILDDLVRYFNGESTSGGIGDETKPGTGGGGGVVIPTTGNTFTLVISRDNGTIIKQKVFDIDNSKNALDYLKTMANVTEKSGFITGIDGNSSVSIEGLTNSDRKAGYYGVDWFIYLNGSRSGAGIQSVNIQPGSTLNLDYHKWDWHDLMDPGTTAVPLSLSIPDSIQSGKSFSVKFTCAGKPVYGGAISVDGKSTGSTTDQNGNADITINTSGSYEVKAEKDSGQDKGSVTKTVNVSSGGGGGSSTIDVTGVTLNTSKVTMAQGNILRLKATVEPDEASNKNVTWSSSDD